MKRSVLAALPLCVLVSACGGGGGGGSGGGNPVVVTPAPTATPTPTPTPTPPPAPAPAPTPTATPTPAPLPSPAAIAAGPDWSTVQRDAGHTGYVPARYSSSDFADAWTITTPGAPSEVAARAGSVFFNTSGADNRVYTRAVSTTNGALLWGFDLGQGGFGQGRRPYGPAYANNRVASISYNMTSTAASFQLINAGTGGYLGSLTYDAQFSDGSTPTPVGDEIYYAAGYYGNVVYGGNASTGNRMWRTEAVGQYGGYVMQGESVAVDQYYVYFFKGGSLVAMLRDGTVAKIIANPFFTRNGISYSGEYAGAPMLDGQGRIFVFSDNYSRGQSLPIAAFSLNSDRPLWRTGYSYTGQPAVRGDRLFAVRSSSTIVDLVDTATGLLSASVDVGGTGNLSSNVVVSDTHLFVSSATTTYAVDLTRSGYPVAWRTQHGGSLAITPDGYLIISTATGLHAVKLT